MTRRVPGLLPPPTMAERAAAARAARALRAALDDPPIMGEPFSYHMDLSRPRRGLWVTIRANLPGFRRTNGLYQHDALPGWEYTRAEVLAEMIPDLEALAERGIHPTVATCSASSASPTQMDMPL